MNIPNKGGRQKIAIKARNAWKRHRPKRPGRIKAIAGEIGITPAAVSAWRQVPAERLGIVAAYLGVPPAALRHDLFPTEPAPSFNPWDAIV